MDGYGVEILAFRLIPYVLHLEHFPGDNEKALYRCAFSIVGLFIAFHQVGWRSNVYLFLHKKGLP